MMEQNLSSDGGSGGILTGWPLQVKDLPGDIWRETERERESEKLSRDILAVNLTW